MQLTRRGAANHPHGQKGSKGLSNETVIADCYGFKVLSISLFLTPLADLSVSAPDHIVLPPLIYSAWHGQITKINISAPG